MFSKHLSGQWVVLTVGMILICGSLAWAKQATITLKNGNVIRGDITRESDLSITIAIQGINTTYQRSEINQIRYELGLMDEYQNRRKTIKREDYGKRVELGRWLYSKNTKQGDGLAQAELVALLKDRPNNAEAKILLQLTNKRIAQRLQSNTGTGTTTGPKTPSTSPKVKDWPRLNMDQIRLMKVYAVNLNEKPNVVIAAGTLDMFYEKYKTNDALAQYEGRRGKQQFKRLKGYEQLGLIFDCQAREFYGNVIIRQEPRMFKTFRTSINPTLGVRYCASCHGKSDITKFYLFTKKPNTEETAYTNFYIMSNYKGGGSMIDAANPLDSLLIQYALPLNQAKKPHPDVRGLRQYYTGPQDKRIKIVTNWIENELGLLPPKFPIQYKIPPYGPALREEKPATKPTPATLPKGPRPTVNGKN